MTNIKYDFYTTKDNTTIAVSTYAGKTVKGVAKVDPRDKFDAEFGKELAAARWNAKVARKRKMRANRQYSKAKAEYLKAREYLHKMERYQLEASQAYELANYKVAEIESKG